MGGMMHTGTAFWLMQGAGTIEQNGGTYVLAHFASAQATAIFGIIYKTVGLVGAVVLVFTQPLWPAFTDAVTRWDYGWIERAVGKIRRRLMLLAVFLAVGLSAVGPIAIEHVWHVDIGTQRMVLYILAIYLFANIWTHFHYVILMGLDRVWTMAGCW